ncbi:sugar-binding transcriptional regulator [Thermosediminibacter oceani]|uniref:Transcriptional regulator, DeoR family n=1 Tax=Thermosediminibacter oceani (strain ATCC BAA-1034 / DSM 16646 / JW/IW-1228P) TaxID=555079 RepID=D9RZ30_THEOJ|nr:sugar-binding domain-containing protein [Thermosediminibacter oceani]ADL08584.1 transcriptional regulator, DeoR family [Thermosediminibacter oceani DSM 16646]
MEEIASLLKKIAPEMAEIVEQRFDILRNIYYNQPIGRRALSAVLALSERPLRTEVKRLEELGLLEIDPKGMRVSREGEELIARLENFVYFLKGLSFIAERIKEKFECEDVLIIPGNSDRDETVKKQLGREAASYLRSCLKNGDVIAVTGGTTMAQVPKGMPNLTGYEDVVVVPARGGLGERVELQANTIAAELAGRLGAQYRLLYVPDNLGPEAMESIVNEPGIKEVIALIRRADIVVHGIGGAEEMARRRGLSESEIRRILENGAVAEAFGFYFDHEGRIVYSTTSAGLSVKDLKNIRKVIAIAGGSGKAPAIRAFLKYHRPTILITDEGAAKKLLEIEGGKNA